MPPALQFLVLTFAGWVNRHQDDLIAYLREENRVLREHLGPRPLRRTDAQRRRLAVRGQQLGRRVLMQVAGIVTPDTILRWYRRLIAQTYDGSARRGRGRPMPRRDVAARVVRMAVEHPQWGYTRIRGALSNLGHEIARTTVKRILHDHGIDPAPERSRRMPGKTFLQAHGEGRTACDLFTAEVAHAGRAPAVPGLLRDRAAVPPRDHRRDPSAAVRHVDGADGPQCDGPGRWLLATRPLSDARPRPALHAGVWRDPRGRGCSADPSPAEESQSQRVCRAVRPLYKGKCLSRVVPLGEGHVRLRVGEYVDHDHRERTHQGLDNQLLQRPPPPVSLAADVQRRERLGGWLNFYHREAA